MIAAVLRIVLLLLPLVALLLWLRWRLKKDRDEEELARELSRLRRTLVVIVLAAVVAVLGLRFSDEEAGDPRTKYIPPHTENGQVVPGRFVPIEEEDQSEGEDSEQAPS